MNTEQLLEQIEFWHQEDKHTEIVEAVLALPEEERNDELMGLLAAAYNNLQDYDDAIKVLEQLRPRQENTDKWQFRMGYALYYLDKNEEAKAAFSRCLILNESETYAEDCQDFLDYIQKEQAQENESIESDKQYINPEVYNEEQWKAVEGHIIKYFGNYTSVFHEILSPDIHVDICIIPPNDDRNYYTLVTMGMGAHQMNVPAELAEHQLERAELVISLSPDWKVGENEELWYWPTRLLKQLARLPCECDTWLGWGHTVENQKPYTENTSLCGSILLSVNAPDGAEACPLPDGEKVNFYQVLPIYSEEMKYKQANNAQSLFARMKYIPFVTEPDRPNCCEAYDEGPLAKAMMKYLDCPCRYFPPTLDDDEIVDAYHKAALRGKQEGFVPILVAADDETLWECLVYNSDAEIDNLDGIDFGFNPKSVADYRERTLKAPLPDGEEATTLLLKTRREEAAEDDRNWEEDVLGEITDGENGEIGTRFIGYWDYSTDDTIPLILAEIPVKNPWEIFAYLPFGGWNDCPGTTDLMAVSKYWFESHGASPAVITHDVLEFALSAPVKKEQAMQLALEQYVWCPDIIEQSYEGATVGSLAGALSKSVCWYFWWD